MDEVSVVSLTLIKSAKPIKLWQKNKKIVRANKNIHYLRPTIQSTCSSVHPLTLLSRVPCLTMTS